MKTFSVDIEDKKSGVADSVIVKAEDKWKAITRAMLTTKVRFCPTSLKGMYVPELSYNVTELGE